MERANPGNAVRMRVRTGRGDRATRERPGWCGRILLTGAVSWIALFALGPMYPASAAQDTPLVLEPEETFSSRSDVQLHLETTLGEGEQAQPRTGSLWTDTALLLGGTLVYTAIHPHVRPRMLERGSLANIRDNFTDPVGRALRGTDRDPFFVNYVSHPVTWGGTAGLLRARGHSPLEAFAVSQGHSVLWEYVIEGSFAVPSGRDMVTNFVSAAVEVFVLHPLLFD